MSLWSGCSSESDVWGGLSIGPIRDPPMEKNDPIHQELMFLWQEQTTASHKTIQPFWQVGMCPSPWLQQLAQTGDAMKVFKTGGCRDFPGGPMAKTPCSQMQGAQV